jgi:hypothetical protein
VLIVLIVNIGHEWVAARLLPRNLLVEGPL